MLFVQVAYQKRLTEILDFELETGLIEFLFTTFVMRQQQFWFDVRLWTNQTYKDCRFTFQFVKVRGGYIVSAKVDGEETEEIATTPIEFIKSRYGIEN